MQSLVHREEYKARNYADRILPVQFGEKITIGFNTEGEELGQSTKSFGAQQLVIMLQQGTLRLSEIDHEGTSELERITKQRSPLGQDQYYILSDRGNGKAVSDHIFASMICYTVAVRDTSFLKKKKRKLGKSGGKNT
jgi:hypothetical protein